ncbi:MAG: glycosyltransferase family 39 protein [Anaerolineae bacterium]|nr:glycosyltransferase family 39 protein [Anaerolineae bacterium]
MFAPPNLVLAAIIVLGAFLRFYRLDEIPPGFQFDQAYYVLDALFLLHGDFHIFFREPGRSEPLFQYLLIPWVALFGSDTPLAPKITATLLGIATIFLIYGLARALFRSTPLALLAALFTAISFWHIFYSRYGERIPLTLFFATLTFWFFWRALIVSGSTFHVSRFTFQVSGFQFCVLGSKFQTWRNYLFVGIFTGLTLYTYPSGRVVPIALILITAYAALTDRARARYYLQGLVLAGIIAAIIFLPLGIYYLQHPLDFISHTAEVSIFVPHGDISDNVPLELTKNALKILGMFFVVGDSGVLRNIPYRPIFDPFVGALFVIGVVAWMAQFVSRRFSALERTRAVFLAVWLGCALALSLFSDDAPNNGRTLIGLPVVMILPAWGATIVWERARAASVHRLATIGLGIVIISSALLVARDTFIVWANDPGTYYAFNADKVELAQWINRNARTHHLYLAPVTSQVGTVMLLTRHAPVKSFDSRDTIVLPSRAEGKDALFVFPTEQEKRAQTLTTRLGALATREQIIGSNGAPLALIVRVPASYLPNLQSPISNLSSASDFLRPQHTTRAVWGDAIELLGYSIEASDAAKRNLEVTLFLRALAPMNEDYTFSVKVRDAKDRVWGQEDKWAGSNSYATTQWSVGDVIVERFYPGLSACAPAGAYRITVEVYEPKTMRVLARSDSDKVWADLGVWYADASSGNLYEHLEPQQRLDAQVAPQMRLLGYSLDAREIQVGAEFSLSLFWHGWGDGTHTRRIVIRLRDTTARDFVLLEKDVTLAREGRGICLFADVQLPREVAPGTATLWVNDVQITTVRVMR